MKRLRLLVVALTLSLALAALPAAGQQVDFGEMNNKAVELSQSGEFMKAIEIWLKLVEQAGPDHEYLWAFHMSIGRNFQKLLTYPEAWWHLNRSVEITKGQKEKPVEWLTEVEQALATGYSKAVVVVASPGGAVGMKHGSVTHWYKAPVTWWFKPGEAELTIRADQQAPTVRKFNVTRTTTEVVLSFDPPKDMGELAITVDQPEATILIGDQAVGKGSVKRQAKPGSYNVTVRLEGFEEWRKKVQIEGGRVVSENVVLKPTAIGDGGVPKGGEVKRRSAGWKWALLGSAAAVGAAGGVTYFMAASNLDTEKEGFGDWLSAEFKLGGKVPSDAASQAKAQDEWNSRVDEKVKPLEMTSYALWGVAGAVAVTGAILLVTHDPGPAEKSAQLFLPVAPMVTPGGTGLEATWQF